jgi:hypothetical protein
MTRWWEAEGREMFAEQKEEGGLRVLDMAAGRYVCKVDGERAVMLMG